MIEPTPTPSRSQYLWYMTGIVSYVAPLGIQMILFPWLIAVQLNESAERLGIAQMMTQLPGLFLVLLGGLIADKIDARKILIALHITAAVPAAVVAAMLYYGHLNYTVLIIYALAMGTVNAFINPARDGMLSRVASGKLQQTVTVAMGLTFGAQLIGFTAARSADTTGAVPLLILQSAILFVGAFIAARLNPAPPYVIRESGSRLAQINRGLTAVWESARMRSTVIMLTFMSFFYGGTFMVLNPLMIRDVYGGSAVEISASYSVFVVGTVASTIMMVSFGGIVRQGRALLLAVVCGGLCLSLCFFNPSYYGYLALIGAWGMCGGVAMSMGRTIMQESAPAELRARVLSVFALSNIGGAPLGAFTLGFMAKGLGVVGALMVVVGCVWLAALVVFLGTDLVKVRTVSVQGEQVGS